MAKKKAPTTPAEEVGAPTSESCANCGQPATVKTTNPGANVTFYCHACGSRTYPENVGQLAPL